MYMADQAEVHHYTPEEASLELVLALFAVASTVEVVVRAGLVSDYYM